MMGFLSGIYGGIKAARRNSIPHYHYENLTYTPYLYGSDHLTHLYKFANDDQKELIHTYITDTYKVDHIESYAAIKESIEKDLKIGAFEPKVPKSHYKKTSYDLKGGMGDDDDGYFPF